MKAYALGHHADCPRHWDIQVSIDGINWNTPHQIRNNKDDKKGHIFKFNKHIGFIRYFKLINKKKSSQDNNSSNYDLYITNIDLYGNVVECGSNCNVLPHILFSNHYCKTKRINLISLIPFIYAVS